MLESPNVNHMTDQTGRLMHVENTVSDYNTMADDRVRQVTAQREMSIGAKRPVTL